jgi:predicted ATPase/class 3 adenylate cyclase
MSTPARTFTFLFTDVEGSTRLWEQHPEMMGAAMARHDAVMDAVVQRELGVVVKSMGDGVLAVFESPMHGLAAAVAAQQAIGAMETDVELHVRMAVHCGPASERDADYFGPTLNRAARVMGLGHGGQILVSEAVAVLVRDEMPEGVTLLDLGEHRLRDLTNVERVFQVCGKSLRRDFAPLRSLDSYRSNLPFQPTSFIGRASDVDRLIALVREHRLVTLTGVGGVGKTRLALRVAAELLPDLRDGVVICELASAESDQTVDEIVAQALGIAARTGLSLHDSVVEALRDRDGLLVLDNCEHVLDAAAQLASDVLQACTSMRLIATSREAIALDGEQLFGVKPLEVPETASLDAANGGGAIALFSERARAIDPSFVVDDQNVRPVVEICRRLDGIPLAIELAAARTASMRPADIAGLLDERFRLLSGGRRRSVERHQTLRTVVDWSYSLLDDRTRDLFARLGVCTGSFDAATAAAVAGDDVDRFDVIDALEELVAKSMLTVDTAGGGPTRYQLLETFRQYALERLAETDALDEVRFRHAHHFISVTATLGPRINGPDEIVARQALRRDLDNLRAAVDWAIDEHRSDVVAALLAPIAQESGWDRSCGVGAWCTRALTVAPENGTPSWDWVLAASCFHRYTTGAWPEARQTAVALINRTAVDGEVRSWAYALRGFTDVAQSMEASIAALREGVTAITDQQGPQTLSLVASFAMYTEMAGNHDEAVLRADDALARAAALHFPSGTALAHLARGFVHSESDPAQARADLEAALALTDEGAAEIVADHAWVALAGIEWNQGRWHQAAAATARALERSARLGDYSAVANTLVLAVSVLGTAGHFEHAIVADAGLRGAELFGEFGYATGDATEQARAAAVVAARQQLDTAVVQQAETTAWSMTREEFLRYVIADLTTISGGAAERP